MGDTGHGPEDHRRHVRGPRRRRRCVLGKDPRKSTARWRTPHGTSRRTLSRRSPPTAARSGAYAIGVAHPFSCSSRRLDGEAVVTASRSSSASTSTCVGSDPVADLDLPAADLPEDAAYGHFGRDDHDFTWERTTAAALRDAAGLLPRHRPRAQHLMARCWCSSRSTSGCRCGRRLAAVRLVRAMLRSRQRRAMCAHGFVMSTTTTCARRCRMTRSARPYLRRLPCSSTGGSRLHSLGWSATTRGAGPPLQEAEQRDSARTRAVPADPAI